MTSQEVDIDKVHSGTWQGHLSSLTLRELSYLSIMNFLWALKITAFLFLFPFFLTLGLNRLGSQNEAGTILNSGFLASFKSEGFFCRAALVI